MPQTRRVSFPVEFSNSAAEALLRGLETVLPVRFDFSRETGPETAGEILAEGAAGPHLDSTKGLSSLTVASLRPARNEAGPAGMNVRFRDDPEVPFPFRGRALRTKAATITQGLALSRDERPLAECEQGVIWAVSERGGARRFRTAFALPGLGQEETLVDYFHGGRFLDMLPLIHWLRGLCEGQRESDSPVRACFVFDDPNLHWPRYGFVDFDEIATHARAENYHVSFATIPLDAWFTHRRTAQIFQQNAERLSLCVHGNNHLKQELAGTYSEAQRLHLLRQAHRRIERLERDGNVKVCRVMVPPHGACSEEMLASLPAGGFDGACISHGSLRAHNRSREWTRGIGLLPFERIRGCPVLPRWGLSGDLTNTVLVAAYLRQAVILRGHHQDLKDGIELLDRWARCINSLGAVRWSRLSELCRIGYSARTAEVGPRAEVASPVAAPHAGVNGKVASGSVAFAFLRRLLTEGRDRLMPS